MRPNLEFGCRWALCVMLGGCATGTFQGGIYRDSQTAYQVGPLDADWHRYQVSDGNLVFHDNRGGSIVANALCEGITDAPLDVLVNQALIGLEHRQELDRQLITLDGRAALKTRLSATLDGVPVELELVVTKKDGCTYDFQLVAAAQTFEQRESAFLRFVEGFRQLPRGS